MSRWTDDDIFAVEDAIDRGIITVPRDTIIDNPGYPDDQQFVPMSFPAELKWWGSVRTGDIEIRLVVPNQWVSLIQEMQTAMRKRLVVHLTDFDEGT